jgi:glycosyltransferase involved in cell wall biosynthesis
MTRSLRVLMVSGEYPPMEGGVGDFTHLLGRAMADQGAEVHVLTSARAREGAPPPPPACHPLVASWDWAALYSALRRLLGAVRPDVVNVQYQAAAYGMHPAVNLLPYAFPRLPIVTTFHDVRVPYLFPKAGPVRWWANLALARGSRAAIVTNAEDRELLARHRLPRLEVIPIGSNIAPGPPPGYDRGAWRARWGAGADTLLVGYFGLLNASKGGEELVRALDELVRYGYNVRLLIVGGGAGASDPTNREYLERVRGLVAELGLGAKVVWTGHLPPEDASAALASVDVCALPYRDGASFRRGSLMAALAHGLPIVTTWPCVSVPELTHGHTAWLVPPEDPVALAQGIARLAGDAALARSLAVAAAELAREFDWQRIAARTLEVLYGVTT